MVQQLAAACMVFKTDLHVAEQKCSGLTQGLTTVTVRLAVPTLPALSVAEYVTV